MQSSSHAARHCMRGNDDALPCSINLNLVTRRHHEPLQHLDKSFKIVLDCFACLLLTFEFFLSSLCCFATATAKSSKAVRCFVSLKLCPRRNPHSPPCHPLCQHFLSSRPMFSSQRCCKPRLDDPAATPPATPPHTQNMDIKKGSSHPAVARRRFPSPSRIHSSYRQKCRKIMQTVVSLYDQKRRWMISKEGKSRKRKADEYRRS
ncbi:hypothetical protein VTI28DRAFT_9788 [Corynascus sepedonium]